MFRGHFFHSVLSELPTTQQICSWPILAPPHSAGGSVLSLFVSVCSFVSRIIEKVVCDFIEFGE